MFISLSYQKAIAVVGAVIVLGLVSLLVVFDILPKRLLIMAPLAIVAVIFLVHKPFYGLATVVFLAQVDTFEVIFFSWSPISATKGITALLLIAFFIDTQHRQPWPRLDEASLRAVQMTVLFVLFVMISAVFADNFGRSRDSIQRLLGVCALAFLIVVLARKREHLEALLLLIMASTLFSAVFVLADSLTGQTILGTSSQSNSSTWEDVTRSSGATNHGPTQAAAMLIAGTTLAMIYVLRRPKDYWYLTFPTAALGTLAIAFNLTRHTALIWVAMFVWFIFKSRGTQYFPAIAGLCLVIAVLALPLAPAELFGRLQELAEFGEDRTILRRVSYLTIGYDAFLKNPITGIGINNFPEVFVNTEYRWVPGRTNVERPFHNIYAKFAVETGIFGFIAFVMMLLQFYRLASSARKVETDPRIMVMAEAIHFSYVTALLENFFLSSGFRKYLWIYFGLSLAVYLISRDSSSKASDKPTLPA